MALHVKGSGAARATHKQSLGRPHETTTTRNNHHPAFPNNAANQPNPTNPKQQPQQHNHNNNTTHNEQVVTGAAEARNAVAACATSEALRSMLPHLLEQLELCQKSLSAYLEAKRAEFPR